MNQSPPNRLAELKPTVARIHALDAKLEKDFPLLIETPKG